MTSGTCAKEISRAAGARGQHFETREDLIRALPELLREGDCILVKASKGSHFEIVSAALRKDMNVSSGRNMISPESLLEAPAPVSAPIVLLDLDDTILDFRKAEHRALARSLDELGIHHDEEVLGGVFPDRVTHGSVEGHDSEHCCGDKERIAVRILFGKVRDYSCNDRIDDHRCGEYLELGKSESVEDRLVKEDICAVSVTEAFPVDFARSLLFPGHDSALYGISGALDLLCLMLCGKHGIFVEVCLELPDNKNEHGACSNEETEVDQR